MSVARDEGDFVRECGWCKDWDGLGMSSPHPPPLYPSHLCPPPSVRKRVLPLFTFRCEEESGGSGAREVGMGAALTHGRQTKE